MTIDEKIKERLSPEITRKEMDERQESRIADLVKRFSNLIGQPPSPASPDTQESPQELGGAGSMIQELVDKAKTEDEIKEVLLDMEFFPDPNVKNFVLKTLVRRLLNERITRSTETE